MSAYVKNNITNKSLSDLLVSDRARKIVSKSWGKRAAVSLLFDSNDIASASVLMIQRAKHESDPWSGQMAFPGGRREKSDKTTLETAKRETFEEVGLDIDSALHSKAAYPKERAQLLGRLSDINVAQRNLKVNLIVTPYIFGVKERPELAANYEVADLVWIPLSYFADFSNRKQHRFSRGAQAFDLPCYHLGGDQLVWGLSLAMIDELLTWMGSAVPETENLHVLDRAAFELSI